MTGNAPRRPVRATVLALVLALAATLLAAGTGSSAAAAEEWWNPAARPQPDSGVNVTGEPFGGADADGRVRGFVDAHNHLMSDQGFGGRLICGSTFSEKGVADALKDCPEHYPDGARALFENVTGGADGHHDPVGWPTFRDWPAHDSLSHQQNYYAWVERAWRGGQRVLVNDLVTNGLLCSLYPYKDRGCDEMDSIRLQARRTYELQDHIDRMYGGPGRGWFRVVTDAEQARDVVRQGRLAVVLGVETSEPFGCKQILDIAQCDEEDIDRGLDELYALGVRSMFLCHKFDNALCGVRFDSGTIGTAVNAGQFLSTGTFWKTERCTGPQSDNPIGLTASADAASLLPDGVSMPSYAEEARCNTRGLTRLGEYALRGMMQRNMMLEIDHMSVKAAGRAFDILESESYPGVISSHSWMDLDWTERLYRLGGFVAQYANAAEGFVEEARRTAALRDTYGAGYGYGSDMNGVGGWPGPVGEGAANSVRYPFTSADGGSVLDRQVTGERTWDLNTDGLAHNGLLPDWIEQIRLSGGGAQDVVDDLLRGAESYLGTWRATERHRAGTDLAAGAPATASSTQWWNPFADHRPGRAFDGDRATRWASEWSDDQWLRVDLGAVRSVDRVVVDWERAYGREYRIEVSTDGSRWRTVWSTAEGDGGLDTARFDATAARFVRLHGLRRGTGWGYSVHEMGVYRS